MWETVVAVALNPIFILVVVFMAAQLVNWLKVLDHADLSYAKPFTSLSYVTVCVLSVLLLGEHIAADADRRHRRRDRGRVVREP